MEYEQVLVNRADLENLIARVEKLQNDFEEYKSQSFIRNKIEAHAKGGMLSASGVCKIMDWSTRTFYRRVEAGEFPATLENGTRWKIGVDDFLKWYKESFVH